MEAVSSSNFSRVDFPDLLDPLSCVVIAKESTHTIIHRRSISGEEFGALFCGTCLSTESG